MSMANVIEALEIIAANPKLSFFAGPRDYLRITSAERALGGQLPPSYREFVKSLGAGSIGAFEIYGIVDANFEESAVPNGIWLTLNERREHGLPANLIVIGSTGDGDYYCIEQRNGEESPVFLYRTGVLAGDQVVEQVACDFGEFLLNGVRREMLAIKT